MVDESESFGNDNCEKLIMSYIEQKDANGLISLSKLPEFELREEAALEGLKLIIQLGADTVRRFMDKINRPDPEMYGSENDASSIERGWNLEVKRRAIKAERARGQNLAWKRLLGLSEDAEFPKAELAREAAVAMAELELEKIEAVGNWRELRDVATLLPVDSEHPLRKKAAKLLVEFLITREKWGELLEVVQDKRFPTKATGLLSRISEARVSINRELVQGIGKKSFAKPEKAEQNEGLRRKKPVKV